jgi:hypothetical protein
MKQYSTKKLTHWKFLQTFFSRLPQRANDLAFWSVKTTSVNFNCCKILPRICCEKSVSVLVLIPNWPSCVWFLQNISPSFPSLCTGQHPNGSLYFQAPKTEEFFGPTMRFSANLLKVRHEELRDWRIGYRSLSDPSHLQSFGNRKKKKEY